eukprot:TRINITY_DN12103_c0_g1_i1.p1 TRINITY_DN12103_c0_g1~~TRINITY_DN12103_c0_g1_i1.p1  ORF type:complete len:693 (-),score=139.84 TRINITY_DN12103_c0_g1_i1:17-1843(-)
MQMIDESSINLTNYLSEKRSKISNLSSIHMLLEKLQFLAKIPTVLQEGLDTQKYGYCSHYYAKTKDIIEKYQHIPSFKRIMDSSTYLSDQVHNRLWEKLEDLEVNGKRLKKYIGFLLVLRKSSPVEIQQHWIKVRLEFLKKLVEPFKIFPIVESNFNPFFDALHKTLFPSFVQYVETFQVAFIDNNQEFYNKRNVVALLEESICAIFEVYIQTVSQKLLESNSPSLIGSAIDIILQRLDETNTEYFNDYINIGNRTSGLINSICSTLVGHNFKSFLGSLDELLNNVGDELSKKSGGQDPLYYQNIVDESVNFINNGLEDLMNGIEPMIMGINSPTFISSLAIGIYSLFEDINARALNCIEIDGSELPSKTYLLIITRLWLSLESNAVEVVETRIREILERTKSKAEFDISPKELKDSVYITAQKVLSHYVRLKSQKIGAMIRTAISTPNWLNRKEPRAVEMIIEMVLDEIRLLETHLSKLFPDNMASRVDRGRRSNVSSTELQFLKQLQFFGNVEFNGNAVLSAIIKICLKTFLECVRLTTLSDHGFQQIQVNIYFMRNRLNETASEPVLNNLLDEIYTCASERSLDPIPLDDEIVSKICEEALQKSK